MDKRFFNKAKIDSQELEKAARVLETYENEMTDENWELYAMIEESISKRATYNDLYDSVERLLKGQVLPDDVNGAFSINTGNNEALVIMNSKAALFDTRSIKVELRPKSFSLNSNSDDSKKAQQQKAKEQTIIDINNILNESYLNNSKFNYVIADAIKYSRGYPIAISMLGWDNNATLGASTDVQGDITCENIPIHNFWWDPAANNIDDCEFVFVNKILPYFRIAKFATGLSNSNPEVLDAYYITSNLDTSSKGSSDLRDNQVLVNNGAIEMISLFKIKDKKVKVYHLVGRKYIIGTQTYDIPYLPFAILKEQEAPDSFTGISSVMLAMPNIKQKYFIDQICNNIALMQKDPIIFLDNASGVDGRQIVDWQTNQRGKVCGTNVNPTQTAYMLPSPVISNDLLTWRQYIEQDINKAIGSSDVANGLGYGSATNGAAVNAMVEQSTIKENTAVVELGKYLVRFVRIVLAFIANKWPKQVNKELTFRASPSNTQDPTDPYDVLTIPKENLELINMLELDVNINAELLRTSKRNQNFQQLLQLYQIEMQYNEGKADFVTIASIINEMDLPNKDAILQRFKANEQANKLQKSVTLVNAILQLLQSPSSQGMDVETATAQILSLLDRPGGEEILAQQMQQIQQQDQQIMEQQQAVQDQAAMMQMAGMMPQQGGNS